MNCSAGEGEERKQNGKAEGILRLLAGVGKTYTMLEEAQRSKGERNDSWSPA